MILYPFIILWFHLPHERVPHVLQDELHYVFLGDEFWCDLFADILGLHVNRDASASFRKVIRTNDLIKAVPAVISIPAILWEPP